MNTHIPTPDCFCAICRQVNPDGGTRIVYFDPFEPPVEFCVECGILEAVEYQDPVAGPVVYFLSDLWEHLHRLKNPVFRPEPERKIS